MKALLVIDIQKGLTKKALYKKDDFISTVNASISKARGKGYIVVFVQHENKQLAPGTEDWEIDENIFKSNTDKVFPKNKGDAFSNPDLIDYFCANSIEQVAVCGLVTHGCIKHTCLGGLHKGYDMSLVKDAHTCWNKDAKEKIEETQKVLAESGIAIIEADKI